MRKGQKKKKDVMEIKDHAMVKFWFSEQSPLFKESNHQFIDSIFTREPRLKNVRVQIRTMFDPATQEVYTSYELSLIEPEEGLRTVSGEDYARVGQGAQGQVPSLALEYPGERRTIEDPVKSENA